MATAVSQAKLASSHIKLAKTLPIRLQKFFALNPPRPTLNRAGPAPSDSNLEEDVQLSESASQEARQHFLNPFLPHKNPATGRWHPPIYSLRRQAELVKMAKEHGVEDLLPFTSKNTEEKLRRRVEHGLQVQGTGVGRKVKGHKWERTMKGRLEMRRQAMLDMPQLIQKWKQRGHGRGWTKWPK